MSFALKPFRCGATTYARGAKVVGLGVAEMKDLAVKGLVGDKPTSATKSKATSKPVDDGLDGLALDKLVRIAKTEGTQLAPNADVTAAIAAIRAKRATMPAR